MQLSLKIYASDNGGKYTAANRILEFTDHRTGQHMAWLHRNSLTETSPANEVLLAAPVASPDGNRTVGFNDGSVRNIPETEFQTL
ncbi:MAG: hypothetical protein ABI318_05265 [Chthoniobacteraceae bacterium]